MKYFTILLLTFLGFSTLNNLSLQAQNAPKNLLSIPKYPLEPAAEKAFSQWIETLTGTYHNTKQKSLRGAADPHFILHAAEIWPMRADGRWIYFEIHDANTPDAVTVGQYVVQYNVQPNGFIHGKRYKISSPKSIKGLWKTPEAFNSALSVGDLQPLGDCAITVECLQRNTFKAYVPQCHLLAENVPQITAEYSVDAIGIRFIEKGYDQNGHLLRENFYDLQRISPSELEKVLEKYYLNQK